MGKRWLGKMQKPKITISVVSHLQATLIEKLLTDLNRHCVGCDLELLLTLNLPEALPFNCNDYFFPVRIIENRSPMGFGANHDQAFLFSSGDYFCVVNPDISLEANPFSPLLDLLADGEIGVVAPKMLNAYGGVEDSARYFPAPLEIIGKVFRQPSRKFRIDETVGFPDWVAGMFMLFRRDVFKEVGGFDTRYFMYYEDVDLCARLTLRGYRVALCNAVAVVHDARRSSHTNLRYLKWHLTSMVRFFTSVSYLEILRARLHKRKAS
jgi:N-acetylglucosaminyl-diphospho-decaprenol L-rhamnosyltransferase